MIFNPLTITEEIHKQYIDFFKSSFVLNNEELSAKLDGLAQGNHLWKSPFISITQNYKTGQTGRELSHDTGISNDVLDAILISKFYKHQELAIKNIVVDGRHTIVSSGTGSGKTETFLIPILDDCVKMDNQKGTKAVLIYPMNALANDQVDRIRDILFRLNNMRKSQSKREITFGIYTSQTPESTRNIAGKHNDDFDILTTIDTRCPSCLQYSLHVDSDGVNTFYTCRNEKNFKINYQIITRKELRDNPPDILITNYVQLEYLLLRKKDSGLFQNNKIKFLVLDELHSYQGARGVDVGLLIRRFRRRIQKNSTISGEITCIGTSATISKDKVSQDKLEKIANFASRIFGVTFNHNDIFEGIRESWKFPPAKSVASLSTLTIPSKNLDEISDDDFNKLCKETSSSHQGEPILDKNERSRFLGKLLLENNFFQYLINTLAEPCSVEDLRNAIINNVDFCKIIKTSSFVENEVDDIIWSYLRIGSMCNDPNEKKSLPLVRVSVHNFWRKMPHLFICTNMDCRRIFYSPRNKCDNCSCIVESLGVCRACGKEFLVSRISQDDLIVAGSNERRNSILAKAGQKEEPTGIRRYPISEVVPHESKLWFSVIRNEADSIIARDFDIMRKCLKCGSFSPENTPSCDFEVNGSICRSTNFINTIIFIRTTGTGETSGRPHDCPYCGSSYGSGYVITEFDMASKQACVNLFNMIYDYLPNHKLLIFADNRQDTAALAGWLDFAHSDTALKQLMVQKLKKLSKEKRYSSYREFLDDELILTIEGDWYSHKLEDFDLTREGLFKMIQEETTSPTKLSLEWQGLIEFNYYGLIDLEEFTKKWTTYSSSYKPGQEIPVKIERILRSTDSSTMNVLRHYIITTLNLMRRDGALLGLHRRDYYDKDAKGFIFDANKTTIDTPRGIDVGVINSSRLKFVKYAKQVFDLTDDEPLLIIDAIWHFLVKEGFVIPVGLTKGRTRRQEPVRAYVVDTSKIKVSIPREIQYCSNCLKIYTNLPKNICPTSIRQKLCSNITNTISFDQFSESNDSHFFRLFEKGEPIRMVTKEDSGALDQYERKRIQNDFGGETQEQRKVDVIVATPTLELGVDIGDLLSIGLYKSPPSPSNYLQRIGRAGRREGISFINTFFFDSPIDEFYYRNPQDLINGIVNPPNINFESEKIYNHLNSLIFEEIFTAEGKTNDYPANMNDFLKDRSVNVSKLMNDVQERKDTIAEKIKYVLNNINQYTKTFDPTDEFIDHYLNKDFPQAISQSLDYFEDEFSVCQKGIDAFSKRGSDSTPYDEMKLNDLMRLRKNLLKIDLIGHFFDSNVLPRYAFPGVLVAIEDLGGLRFQGRSRNIAISEFAPGCEVTLRKRIYRSVGIDLNQSTTTHFYICSNCRQYFKKEPWNKQHCPICDSQDEPEEIRSIAPKKIYIKQVRRSVTERQRYTESNLEVFLPHNIIHDSRTIELPSYRIHIKKRGHVRMLETVGQIFADREDESTEDEIPRQGLPIMICGRCGKVKEKIGERAHRNLTSKFSTGNDCRGEFVPMTLHHEMHTNIISLRIETREPTVINPINKKFLTTLKNAIIFAGQSIAEAEEGEIEGQTKENEIILFDNVDGGTGYVDIIYEKFEQVLKRSNFIISTESTTYSDECDSGCMRCLWSFRRKRDIPFIDKQLILPLLNEVYLKDEEVNDKNSKSETAKKKSQKEVIQSNALSLSAATEIKNLIRGATSELLIYSPKFSAQPLDWKGEGTKSWLDIIGAIRNSEKNVKMTIYTKKPENFSDETALLKLSEYDIDIFIVDSNLDDTLLTGTLIIIDQFIREKRMSIHATSSLTEQLWKNFTTLETSHGENEVKESCKKWELLKQNSRQYKNITSGFGEYKVYVIPPADKQRLDQAVKQISQILGNAKKEIKILDAYLGTKDRPSRENIEWYLRKISELIPENISIKVISCNHNSTEISNLAISLSTTGHTTEIVSFNPDYWKPKPIHHRFIIVDDSILIELDKGLRLLFDYEIYHNVSSLTDVKITENKTIVENKVSIFNEYLNYEKSSDDTIRDCPKFDTRKSKQ
ncbi:MAG: DEAD/DEAH box helicase [Nitrosotalea sp.]